MRPYNRAAVLIFDPHGEYGTLSEMRGHPTFATGDGYAPEVKILAPEQIRIRLSSLEYYDLLSLLPDMSDRQQAILSKGFHHPQAPPQGGLSLGRERLDSRCLRSGHQHRR
jgi:hypothetical protein